MNKILGQDPALSQHLSDAVNSLACSASRPDRTSVDETDVPLRQNHLSHCIDKAAYGLLLDSAPNFRSKALALSTSLPHAGDWLNVVPSLGLHLQDREFKLCLSYWLYVVDSAW